MFIVLLQKDLFKGMWSLAESCVSSLLICILGVSKDWGYIEATDLSLCTILFAPEIR